MEAPQFGAFSSREEYVNAVIEQLRSAVSAAVSS
jgi:hypothetical protein